MDENKVELVETESQELAPAPKVDMAEIAPQGNQSIWSNTAMYGNAVKMAKILASSDLVPEGTYKGKAANCLIALDIAARMNMSPLMVMQNLAVVRGRPGWTGQFCVSAINSCGKFTPLEFVTTENGCFAQARRIADGAMCVGTEITWDMVKKEGWYDKQGSKWKTMPDQMFKYRAAAFFARTYCPEVLNGLQTISEIQDVHGYVNTEQRSKTIISLD